MLVSTLIKEISINNEYLLTCIVLEHAYMEYETHDETTQQKHFYYAISGKKTIKHFRYVNKTYYVDVKINIKRISEQLVCVCEQLANQAASAAKDYIESGQFDLAKNFMNIYFQMDLAALGISMNAAPDIHIYSDKDHTDWFSVVRSEPASLIM